MTDVATTDPAIRTPDELPTGRRINVALVYVGLEAAISRWVNIDVGGLSLALIAAGILALLGWRHARLFAAARPYVWWSLVLGYWVLISALAAWDSTTFTEALKFTVWMAFIIPGLGVMLTLQRHRDLLLLGWLAGVGMYVVVAGYRLVAVGELLDTDSERPLFMGLNRNAVNMFVLYIVPFLLAGAGGTLMRRVRWPLLALSGLYLINSGGRTALAGLLIAGLVYAIAQPGIAGRVRVAFLGLLVLAIAVTTIQAGGGQASESADRLTRLVRGERDNSDEARVLVMRKGWNLALDHPAFGVGYGNFKSTPHEVTEEAKNRHVANLVANLDEHNTFVQVMSETGFPGFLAFVATLITLLWYVWWRPRTRESSAAIAAFAAVIVSISFHTALGTALFIPLALMVGIALDRPRT